MVFIYKVKTFSKRIRFLLPLPLEGYSCGGKMDNENISVISFIQGLFSLIPVTGNVFFFFSLLTGSQTIDHSLQEPHPPHIPLNISLSHKIYSHKKTNKHLAVFSGTCWRPQTCSIKINLILLLTVCSHL